MLWWLRRRFSHLILPTFFEFHNWGEWLRFYFLKNKMSLNIEYSIFRRDEKKAQSRVMIMNCLNCSNCSKSRWFIYIYFINMRCWWKLALFFSLYRNRQIDELKSVDGISAYSSHWEDEDEREKSPHNIYLLICLIDKSLINRYDNFIYLIVRSLSLSFIYSFTHQFVCVMIRYGLKFI